VKFASEGLLFIAIAALAAAAAHAAALDRQSWPLWLLAGAFTVLALWVAWFFRDPERTGQRGPQLVIAPADGKVVMVSDVDEPAFLHGRSTRISIFMNVFNVHVNRYPIDGTVHYVHYNRGKLLHAATEKSSLANEQMSVGIESGRHRVLVRQIAGLVARRIVNYSREGDSVVQGERMGIIRFGSRVDLFLPPDSLVRATTGEVTWAGATVLAELPSP